jgi:hypothetical protein
MSQERALAEGGMLRQGANIGRGQMIAAGHYITPNITFLENDAGGDYGALGALVVGLLPGHGGMLASTASEVAGSMSFKEAEALLVVTDTRTGVQVAVVQGSAKARDLSGNLEFR